MMIRSSVVDSKGEYDLELVRPLFKRNYYRIIHRVHRTVAGTSTQYPEAFRALHVLDYMQGKIIARPLPEGLESDYDNPPSLG